MRQRVSASIAGSDEMDSDGEFKTPTNAARRLLAVIRRIECIPEGSSDSQQSDVEQEIIFDSPDMTQSFSVHGSHGQISNDPLNRVLKTFSRPREQILEELHYIQRYVEALDDEYAELKFDFDFDL
jgi:hypothetical protein